MYLISSNLPQGRSEHFSQSTQRIELLVMGHAHPQEIFSFRGSEMPFPGFSEEKYHKSMHDDGHDKTRSI